MIRRTIAAGALAAFALAGSAQASPKPAAAAPALPPADNQKLAHDILAELIAINTVHNHGTLAAAKAMQARFKAAGFSDQDVTLVAIPEHPEQGQLIVRLRAPAPKGKAPKARPVLFIGHLDVVEAKREDWVRDPFVMTEENGIWYGRGTADMKSEDAAAIAALIRLKQEGFVPDRDLIVALTSDEESGDANGVEWLMKTHRDLIDAALVINPDAGGGTFDKGKRLFYGIQTSEKVFVTYKIETTDKGGHSSRPGAENPIYRLAAGLGRIAAYKFPVETTETTRAMFARSASFETGQTAADMLAVAKSPPDLDAAERLSADPGHNARLRTTCVATEITGGHAENALPQRANAWIQCRMIPTDTEAGVKAQIVKVLADPKIAVTVLTASQPAPDSPPDAALFARFSEAIHAEWPGVEIMPSMDLGASDSIYTRAAGLPSYGLSAVWGNIEGNGEHGLDEHITGQRFYEGVQFEYGLMKRLGGGR
jgi:acetylornithine deacetylase/succinyl-diaminopimelate desuccinylase-like protein